MSKKAKAVAKLFENCVVRPGVYVVPPGTMCLLRKDSGQYRKHVTVNENIFERCLQSSEHHYTFQRGEWFLKVPALLVEHRDA